MTRVGILSIMGDVSFFASFSVRPNDRDVKAVAREMLDLEVGDEELRPRWEELGQ